MGYKKSMNQALDLINQQYGNIETYFNEANSAFEQQYQGYYGQSMQDAVNQLAGTGVYESPVSQNKLNRLQKGLGEQYATGKSQLAGQKLSALGTVDAQKISYYQNLAQMQYQRELQRSQKRSSIGGMLGGLGGGLLGSIIPGGGTLVGAQLGSQLGSSAGGFF